MELLSPLLLTLNFNGGRIMAEKIGAGGKLQKFDTTDGEYQKVDKLIEKCSDNAEQDKINSVDNKNNNKRVVNVIKKLNEYKNKPVGTYNYHTGKLVNLTDGYMITFHQNEPDEHGHYKSHFGRYSESEYDNLANKFAKDNDAEVFIGVFDDEPEISFKVKTFEQAKKLMIEHNQKSLWDNNAGDVFENPYYDKTKNPMQGD